MGHAASREIRRRQDLDRDDRGRRCRPRHAAWLDHVGAARRQRPADADPPSAGVDIGRWRCRWAWRLQFAGFGPAAATASAPVGAGPLRASAVRGVAVGRPSARPRRASLERGAHRLARHQRADDRRGGRRVRCWASGPRRRPSSSCSALRRRSKRDTLDRARNAIRALMDLTPADALVRDGRRRAPRRVDEIAIGALIRRSPRREDPARRGGRAWGFGLGGQGRGGARSTRRRSRADSLPAEKGPGDGVFAGTINGRGALDIRVTRLRRDTHTGANHPSGRARPGAARAGADAGRALRACITRRRSSCWRRPLP